MSPVDFKKCPLSHIHVTIRDALLELFGIRIIWTLKEGGFYCNS